MFANSTHVRQQEIRYVYPLLISNINLYSYLMCPFARGLYGDDGQVMDPVFVAAGLVHMEISQDTAANQA